MSKTLGQVLCESAGPWANWDVVTPSYKEELERRALAVVAAHEAAKWKRVEDGLPGYGESVALINIYRWENCGGDMTRNIQAAGYLAGEGLHSPHWSIKGERAMCIDAFTHWAALPPAPGGEK